MKGLKRFSSYTGYGHTFKFGGFFDSPLLPTRDLDVIVIDATIGGSSDLPNFVLRDINKAYLSFLLCGEKKISTGVKKFILNLFLF
jgi:hypothetical protein